MRKIGILFIITIVSIAIVACDKTKNTSATSQTPVNANEKALKPLNAENYPLKGSHLENTLTCDNCHAEGASYAARIKQETCFSCHENYEALAEKTAQLGYDDNIHASPHYPKMDCDLCHKVHSPSTSIYCVMCHSQETMSKIVLP